MSVYSDNITLSREHRILIDACRLDASTTTSLFDDLSESLYQAFLDQAYYHGVFPLIYKRLKSEDELGILPTGKPMEILYHSFRMHYYSIAGSNIRLSAELVALAEFFRKEKIPFLPVKGPLLAQHAYGDITLRQFSDLDIFVRRKDFRRIASMMLSRGYDPYFPIDKYPEDKVLFELNNDCPFYDRRRKVTVEIHWDFFRKLALPTKGIHPWKKTVGIKLDGRTLYTLSHESHLLYHSLHGAKHLWERLVWIVDIDRYIRATPELDWKRIEEMARSMGAWRMFLTGPALAMKFFGTPLPEQIRQAISSSRLELFVDHITEEFNRDEPGPEESLEKLRWIVSLRDNRYWALRTWLEFLFRPGINERRTVVLPDRWFWLYWPLRPLGAGWRFFHCRILGKCADTAENG